MLILHVNNIPYSHISITQLQAFYLGVLLNLRLTPIVVGRHINLKEMWKVGDKQLRDTMFLQSEFVRPSKNFQTNCHF